MALFLCLNLIQLMKHFAIMQGAFFISSHLDK
nr:MAG TPA: hypothetical protein [Caudoviricetes sp.]